METEKLWIEMIHRMSRTEQAVNIRKLAKAGAESESLCRLAECGRVKLSFEACAVRSEYAALFTDEEINACFASLCAYGYYG